VVLSLTIINSQSFSQPNMDSGLRYDQFFYSMLLNFLKHKEICRNTWKIKSMFVSPSYTHLICCVNYQIHYAYSVEYDTSLLKSRCASTHILHVSTLYKAIDKHVNTKSYPGSYNKRKSYGPLLYSGIILTSNSNLNGRNSIVFTTK